MFDSGNSYKSQYMIFTGTDSQDKISVYNGYGSALCEFINGRWRVRFYDEACYYIGTTWIN